MYVASSPFTEHCSPVSIVAGQAGVHSDDRAVLLGDLAKKKMIRFSLN